MPLYDNHFAGHYETGDPRTPVTAGAGCVWPTVPAHRYLLKSTTATGILLGLNTQGILVEKGSPGPAHDECIFNMIDGPAPILFASIRKRWLSSIDGYAWDIGIVVSICGGLEKTLDFPHQTCNRDFEIGNMPCPLTSDETGPDFTAYQVEWNHTTPPA